MSSEPGMIAQPDLNKTPEDENSEVQESQAISEKNADFMQGQADTLKSSYKKHKRKMSPSSENDIPAKVVKKESDFDISNENIVKKTKLDKKAKNADSVASVSITTKKRPLYDMDNSFQSQPKKIKTETDTLRSRDGKKKHIRRRMKHLLQAVLDQMEFYFGDSNLSKDRYLRKLIDSSPDGYVDLTVFGNFNKLQSLHKDGVSMKVLVAAIKKSKLLELNDDGTKVRRVTPVAEISQEVIDSRTVYVEQLPAHANHMWIRSIFSQCGKVVYVSMPVYKTTRMIKGFAFVEFETGEEAAKACMLLNNPLPAKLEEKPGKFPKGNKTLNRLQKMAPFKIDQDSNEENTSDNQNTESKPAAAGVANKKKKKKNTKKKKSRDPASDETNMKSVITETEQAEERKKEQTEGKKKKKKKKKKHQDSSKDKEVRSSIQSDLLTTKGDVCMTEITPGNESINDGGIKTLHHVAESEMEKKGGKDNCEEEKSAEAKIVAEEGSLKKKKNKKRRKGEKKQEKHKGESSSQYLQSKKMEDTITDDHGTVPNNTKGNTQIIEVKLSRKERKRLRQEDIRRKKQEREGITTENTANLSNKMEEDSNLSNSLKDKTASGTEELDRVKGENNSMLTSEVVDCEVEDKSSRKTSGSELTSILKSRKGQERKKVEFDPVPVTNEFVKGREVRKRKKPKKEKLHLRVITKEEWLSLKAEYIAQQKSHMAALKESLRELRQQENQGRPQGHNRVDLEDVFGTKRLKPSQDLKMAHVESLKFMPNVIVQWKCSHDMHRDKIRTMFKEMSGDSIAYIDAKEEAKFGYIRFKDEASAEEFTKLSRRSTSFMARILPVDQQEEYWKKANEDRVKKLGRKKHEKGSEKIARKVFERNKATFFQKPNHIVFNEDENKETKEGEDKKIKKSAELSTEIQDGAELPTAMDTQSAAS